MPQTPEELAYDEAVRGIAQQQQAHALLQSRTGTLLAATAISTSFLGAQALKDGKLTCWGVAAVVCLAVGAVANVAILWPRRPRPRRPRRRRSGGGPSTPASPGCQGKAADDQRESGWVFTLSARVLLSDLAQPGKPAEMPEAFRRVAENLESHYDHNQAALGWLYLAFQFASVLLLAQIGFWLADLAAS